jgi:hypothetical protein
MTKVVVSSGQSLLDIALWMMGGTDALFALADANGLAITDQVVAGQELLIPDGYTVDQQLVNYYSARSLRVNTANGVALPAPEPDELNDFDGDFEEPDFY